MEKDKLQKIEDQIVEFIKRKTDESGLKTVVVGLSGGIDSAVSSALAVKALGADNVIGVTMPCESNVNDLIDGEGHAAQFGITTLNVNLAPTFKAFNTNISLFLSNYNKGNLKARLRMATLYSVAAHESALVLGTCNKSEIMIGYETKYGDGGADLSPIGDLYKFEIRELAEHLGVSDLIISREPSAGLWAGQTDENEMGFNYDTLDRVLQFMEQNDHSFIEDIDHGIIDKIVNMHINSQHKREMAETCIIERT